MGTEAIAGQARREWFGGEVLTLNLGGLGLGMVGLAAAMLALSLVLAFSVGARAASYTAGTPLSTGGKLASGVAVDQSRHDVYVASCGSETEETKACNRGTGGLQEFDSSGTKLSCTLENSPLHPGAVSVNPESGDIDVLNLEALSTSKMLVYGENCGAEKTEFSVSTGNASVPPQSALDPAGNIYFPNPKGKLQKCTPSGVCTELITGLTKPASAALDASGDLYVASGGSSCSNITAGKLIKYKSNGSGGFTEVGAFAGLDGTAEHGEVSTVAVDQKTGQVFVGRGCGSTFKIERYRAGGGKLEELGSGLFAAGSQVIYNQLAVDESTGKVYATDQGHEDVQVFNYAGPVLISLGASVIGEGSVVCEVEGHEEPCSADYETGTTVTVKAVKGTHSNFVKWSNASGSAEGCKNQTATTCMFTISAAGAVRAEFIAVPKRGVSVTVTGPGAVSATAGSPAPASGSISDCTASSGSCTAEYYEGEEPELEATAESSGHFVGWHVSGAGSTTCSGTASPCKITIGASSVSATSEFGFPLTIEKTGPGTVSVSSVQSGLGLQSISCGTHCSEQFATGTMVELVATAATGSQFAGWSTTEGNPGSCTGTTSPCVVTLSEAVKLHASASLEAEALTIGESGPGTVTVQCEEGHGYEACSHPLGELPYGTLVKTTATPNSGAELISLTGTGSATGACTGAVCGFAITQASSVSAAFKAIAHPSELSVFKGGGGSGTVTSLAPHTGIVCGPSCEEAQTSFEEGETIVLEERAQPGSVFAGWIGCPHLSATTCQVTLVSPRVEATAVFLKEGVQGETPTITQFSGNQHGCGEGGIEIKLAAGTTYVCNGAAGAAGAPGESPTITTFAGNQHGCSEGGLEVKLGANTTYVCNGRKGEAPTITVFSGEQHGCGEGGLEVKLAAGTSYVCNGVKGQTGAAGQAGAAGTAGAAGPAGVQGAKGEPGPAGKVTCKIKQHGKRDTVTCTVKYQAKTSTVRRVVDWALTRKGHVVARGAAKSASQIRLGVLRRGRYLLGVAGEHGRVVINVH